MSPYHGSRFNGLAQFEDGEDGITATIINKPVVYTTKDGWRIEVPVGFVTDFASIPRPLWAVIPPRGKYNRPAIIHDYLYHYAPVDPLNGIRCTQARADYILREACENCDDRFTQRWAIFLGLKAGGFVTWNKYRKKDSDGGSQPERRGDAKAA
jgi:Protein of unknown function (DUF1353)